MFLKKGRKSKLKGRLTAFVPAIATKIGKKNAVVTGYILQTVGYSIVYIAGNVLPIIIAGLVIKGIGLAFVAGILTPMIGDVIDFGEKKNGIRLDGITNSVSTIGTKLGTGLGSALVGWLLALGAYDGASMVQADSALTAMKLLVAGIPAVCGIVGVVLALFFNIEKEL